MSTFNISVKIDSTVDITGTTATLTVPTSKTFKGIIGGSYTNPTGDSYSRLTLRKTNAGGAIIGGVNFQVITSALNTNGGTMQQVELGEGVYFLSIEDAGGPTNKAVSFQGAIYANTL